MPEIRLLSSETINQIAAGEVVERPASVVKELFENAVDAGASAVTIEVRDGGIRLIRVTDNGCGIAKNQVRTAFLRHATSKIRDAADLISIQSLGFRGEALASIAAVAEVEMITKTADSVMGVSYRIENGEEKSMEEIGAPDGTTILVRNLFAKLPARRKFLKAPATETSYISQLAEELALSHPEVSVRLIANGQNRLYTSGGGLRKDLIYQVFGRETAGNLIPFEAKTDYFAVKGFLGKPIISRGNRSFENYYINGRYIRSKVIAQAIENGYRSFLMLHRYPFTDLYFTFETDAVDVNVHPQKMEVRFRDEEQILPLLGKLIDEALHGKQLIQDVTLPGGEEKPKEAVPSAPEPFEKARLEAERNILPPNGTGHPGPRFQGFWRKGAPTDTAEPAGRGGAAGTPQEETLSFREGEAAYGAVSGGNSPAQDAGTLTFAQNAEEGQQSSGETLSDAASPGTPSPAEPSAGGVSPGSGASEGLTFTSDISAPQTPAGAQASAEASQEEAPSPEEALWTPPLLSKKGMEGHRLIGQLFATYWLIEYRDKLYIMDQHAAHEKILYEKLKKKEEEKAPLSQMLQPPLVIALSPSEMDLFLRNEDDFTGIGYKIDKTGDREVSLSAVPADLYGLNEQQLFLDILQGFEETASGSGSRMIDHRIATIACKAAVKGNMKITPQEAEALLNELLTLKNPYNCPHGRPTLISISRYELEKRFRRVV